MRWAVGVIVLFLLGRSDAQHPILSSYVKVMSALCLYMSSISFSAVFLRCCISSTSFFVLSFNA